ncbi:MAG: type II and III secretion system protein family protein [Thermodesulfobacteriota bacterium]
MSRFARILAFLSVLLLAASPVLGAGSVQEARRLDLAVGRSLVLDLPGPVARVSVSEPKVASLVLLSPTQVYLAGLAPGAATLTLWSQGDRVAGIYDLEVAPDVARIKEALHRVLPGEHGLGVSAMHGSVALTGAVSSVAGQDTALAVARSFAGDQVVNLLQVAGVQQVLLEVKVAEMTRTALKRLGVNFSYFMGGDFVYSFLNNLVKLNNQGPLDIYPFQIQGSDSFNTPTGLEPSQSVNGMFRFHSGKGVYTGFLDALKEDGLIKVLAEPNLMCVSGRSAEFLAGGEIPVPVPQGLGTVAVEYKKFGVSLNFTPRVIGPQTISLEVAPEVSELDYSSAATIAGFVIPGLNTRKASTTVELGDGQSFAIAGLFRDSVRSNFDRAPGLGDVPVLGTLFSSKQFQKNESELIIIVTPHLARPVAAGDLALPTDAYAEPGELDFFLNGRLSGEAPAGMGVAPRAPAAKGSGLEGDFGHMLPGEARP